MAPRTGSAKLGCNVNATWDMNAAKFSSFGPLKNRVHLCVADSAFFPSHIANEP